MPGSDAYRAFYRSPIGTIEIVGTVAGVSALNLFDVKEERSGRRAKGATPRPVAAALAQLDEYFRGNRRTFTVKLDLGGTPFQDAVWQ